MPQRLTAVLFAVALFFGAITLSTAQTPDLVPSLELSETPSWMISGEESFGCTYGQCVRLCTRAGEEWMTCHTTCNADCAASIE